MNTANIIIGLHDNEDNYPQRPRKPPAVHRAIVLYDVDGERYYPVCGVTTPEEWTAEDTQAPVSCRRCLAWLAHPLPRIFTHKGLFEALITALVGSVRQETRQDGVWTCTGCDTPTLNERGGFNDHKPDCPWPMLNEMLELGE